MFLAVDNPNQLIKEIKKNYDELKDQLESTEYETLVQGSATFVERLLFYTVNIQWDKSLFIDRELGLLPSLVEKIEGSPNRGGICYRVCRKDWCRTINNGRKTDLPNNFRLLYTELKDYAKAGVKCFKIQGREYSISVVRDMVSLYRRIIDDISKDKNLNEISIKKSLKNIEAARDHERSIKTLSLIEIAKGEST